MIACVSGSLLTNTKPSKNANSFFFGKYLNFNLKENSTSLFLYMQVYKYRKNFTYYEQY